MNCKSIRVMFCGVAVFVLGFTAFAETKEDLNSLSE